MLIRFEAITGTSTASLTARAHGRHAPWGTSAWTVGTRASCQPMPTLIASTAPPETSARASSIVSARVPPASTKLAPDIRNTTAWPGPPAARTAAATSRANRVLPSKDPPHSSSRRFVAGARN